MSTSIFCSISNEPRFLPPVLLCFGGKGGLVPSPSADLTRSAVVKVIGYEHGRGGLAAPRLPLAFMEAGVMVPHLCCFIKAKQRKPPGLDGKQDEQVMDGSKEGRKHTNHGTAGRRTLSRGLGPQVGEWDICGTNRTLSRKMNFEMNMGKGRTAKVKQQQWKPCR